MEARISSSPAENPSSFRACSVYLPTCSRVDYVQLDNFSSVVLYNNTGSGRKKGKVYEVERIISRKKQKRISIMANLVEISTANFCL